MVCSYYNNSDEPSCISDFNVNGNLELTNTGNLFIDLAPLIPFVISAINAYITSLAVAQKSLEPTFLNTHYLYSLSNNLVLGNYFESIVNEGLFTTTTYFIPYQSDFKIETAIITTILNLETKILFFQIPNSFSYNSMELAAVATVPMDTGYHAKIQIPQSFVNNFLLNQVFTTEVDIVIPTTTMASDDNLNPQTNASKTYSVNLNSNSLCKGGKCSREECNAYETYSNPYDICDYTGSSGECLCMACIYTGCLENTQLGETKCKQDYINYRDANNLDC